MTRLAVAQTAPAFGNTDRNLARAVSLVESTSADIYLFPELFLSGYTFSSRDELRSCALAPDAPQLERLRELTEDRDIAICGGYAEAAPNGAIYNSSFLMGDGKLLATYRKTHLFSREQEFFEPGDTGFSVTEYHGLRLGMMICFDWIFPEAARSLALLGAQVILHPANLVLPWCQRAMFARAVENRVFVATANRVGTESNTLGDNLTFTGQSQVVTPTGEYVLTFSETETGIRATEIDPTEADAKEINPFNHLLDDRRPALYDGCGPEPSA